MPEQLVPKELPHELTYLWMWFCELSNSRGFAECGALPLSYSEIQAWAQLTRTEPTGWEISVIKQIDREYLKESNKK